MLSRAIRVGQVLVVPPGHVTCPRGKPSGRFEGSALQFVRGGYGRSLPPCVDRPPDQLRNRDVLTGRLNAQCSELFLRELDLYT